jgi:hypothetical protein
MGVSLIQYIAALRRLSSLCLSSSSISSGLILSLILDVKEPIEVSAMLQLVFLHSTYRGQTPHRYKLRL